MPKVPNIQSVIPGLLVSVWHVTEDEDFFREKLTLFEGELNTISNYLHPERRLLWLASRYCLKEMLNLDSSKAHVESLSMESGAPFLSDNSFKISFSHSHRFAAAIASPTHKVSVDLEDAHKDRNLEVARRFMNTQEHEKWALIGTKELYLAIFSAKECLIKMVGKKTSMRDHIHISFDNFDGKRNGTLYGTVQKADIVQHYEVHYHINPDFVLTYATHIVQPNISGEFDPAPRAIH
ncbi:MAG: 4'-phosphopantetheinyl transferase superfamily protein [Bacteroidia bacterium]